MTISEKHFIFHPLFAWWILGWNVDNDDKCATKKNNTSTEKGTLRVNVCGFRNKDILRKILFLFCPLTFSFSISIGKDTKPFTYCIRQLHTYSLKVKYQT